MARLQLALFGGFSVQRDNQPVTEFESDKVRALLAYLAVNCDRPQRRELLTAQFWPDLPERKARHNLRQALFNLRSAIDDRHNQPPFLCVTPQTIQLASSDQIETDVITFIRSVAPCREHPQNQLTFCAQCLPRREAAVGLYHGRFLEGLSLKNCQEFNEWALVEAQNLHQQAIGTLKWLVDIHHGLGQAGPMLAFARQWVTLEPYDESAHRAMMLALALNRQWEAAVSQYENCRHLFSSELGMEPEAQTQTLYEHIAAGKLPIEYEIGPLISSSGSKPAGECPYRGLAAFRETDAPLFFGREVFIDRIQTWLQRQPAFTVVLGPSGSGKSSAVYAGLLPDLRVDKRWLIAEMRPGSDPFESLAGALQALSHPGGFETSPNPGDRGSPEPTRFDLSDWIARLGSGSRTLVLVVDQFEELYTLCPEADARRHFLDELLAATSLETENGRRLCEALLTLRADFMGQALSYRPFADAIQGACLLMGPMNREELKAAIQKPAQIQGVGFEAGLVERILEDVGDEPGNLPLLEFALTLLWEQSANGYITHRAYEQVGRVSGALASYAELVLNNLSADDQERARRIFLQLVQPGEGTQDTRRVALREEFDERQWALIQYLADKRLVVTGLDQSGKEYVEVAHEALIHSWSRFQEWIDADRAFRVWQERLRWNLRQWERTDRHESALLRGLPLAEAEGWQTERAAELSAAEQDYIWASTNLKFRRQQEVDRRRQRAIIGLAIGLVIALTLVFFIWQGRQEARRQASIGLASQAVAEIQGPYPERAVLLALEALEQYPYTWQAEHALGQAVLEGRLRQILTHNDYVNTAEWSADGARILTGSSDGTVHIWEAGTGKILFTISEGAPVMARWSPDEKSILAVNAEENSLTVWDVATHKMRFRLEQADIGGAIVLNTEQWAPWSPDGERFLVYNEVGTVKICDAKTGKVMYAMEGNLGQGDRSPLTAEDRSKMMHTFMSAEGDQALWSPDGLTIAVSSKTLNKVTLWDVASGRELYSLLGGFNNESLVLADWSPSGDRFITRGNGGVKVYDSASGQLLLNLTTPGVSIYRGIWSPDGAYLLTSGIDDGTARVWDANSGKEVLAISNMVFASASDWSATSEFLAVGGSDGLIHIWEPGKARQIRVLSGTRPRITTVLFSPSGDRLLAVGDNNLVNIYDLTEASITKNFSIDNISGPVWSPSGEQIALGLDHTKVKIWDARSGNELVTLTGHQDYLWLVEWSPSGDRFATASNDHTVIIWDARTWTQETTFKGHHDSVYWVGWSPDGSYIASSSQGEVILWDPNSGEENLTFSGHTGLVLVSLWSPDGGRILSVGSNGEAFIWDAATGDVIYRLFPEGFQLDILAAAWAKDGQQVFVASADRIFRSFNASTGKLNNQFEMPWATAAKISLSPNDERVLKGGDGSAKVWDSNSGTELISYDYPGWVDAGYSPDGTQIVIASNLGTLDIYPTWQSTQELIDYARFCCLVRQLTPEERSLFGLSTNRK